MGKSRTSLSNGKSLESNSHVPWLIKPPQTAVSV